MSPRNERELAELAAREGYGALFSAFGTVRDGLYACDAVDSLVDASAIDTLLSNFIVPLQSDDISKPDASGGLRPCQGRRQRQHAAAGHTAASACASVRPAACPAACRRAELAAAGRVPLPLQACTACTAPSTSTPRRGG